jgi:SAV_6107-like HEPN
MPESMFSTRSNPTSNVTSGPSVNRSTNPSRRRTGDRGWAAPARRSGLVLAAQAQSLLSEAAAEPSADERFRSAHLAALRTAAALFADRARPAARQRPTNAWALLGTLAPELTDWAAYFAEGATKRAAIESGARRVVSEREADDLLRASAEFLAMVETSLGLFDSSRAS